MGGTHPNLMTAQQRAEEAASILAVGILRLWRRREASYCLDSEVVSRMYAMDGNKGEIYYEEQCVGASDAPAKNGAR